MPSPGSKGSYSPFQMIQETNCRWRIAIRMPPASTPRGSAYLTALSVEIEKKLQRVCALCISISIRICIFCKFNEWITSLYVYTCVFACVRLIEFYFFNLIFCHFGTVFYSSGFSFAIAETKLVARVVCWHSSRSRWSC